MSGCAALGMSSLLISFVASSPIPSSRFRFGCRRSLATFQRMISDSLGVDPEEVTQGKGLNDLGATWFL